MKQTLATSFPKSLHCKIQGSLRVVARIILLRHAHSIANEKGILSGQLPGVSLSTRGREQALSLVSRLGSSSLDSIRVSPMQRCQETIQPWLESKFSSRIGKLILDDQLIEMDYGLWSGRQLKGLAKEKLWKQIQSTPSKVVFPDGERFTAMQKRAFQSIEDGLLEKKNGNHLFVSHGDVIKAIVAKLMTIKLDNFQSLVVDPASITVIDFDGEKAQLLAFNDSTSNIERFTQEKKTKRILLGGGSGTSARRRK
ncbi:MAG: histidine phosphatase family protein [Actinobacteria bacterium]|nr:histidine phosphatase family protein [Actinomycetota bacterium]